MVLLRTLGETLGVFYRQPNQVPSVWLVIQRHGEIADKSAMKEEEIGKFS